MKSILVLSLFVLGASASAVTATFDSYSEGYYNTLIVDGGITFSNLDMRITGPYTPNFTIDDAHGDLAGKSGFSANNVLGFGSYSQGPGTAFGRMGSFDFTSGFLAGSASLAVFGFGNDPGMTLTLEGLRGGSVVGSSTIGVIPYYTLTPQTLSLTGGQFDSFRVVSSGPTNSGTSFLVVDDVSINPAPEPSAWAAVGIGAFALSRRRATRWR